MSQFSDPKLLYEQAYLRAAAAAVEATDVLRRAATAAAAALPSVAEPACYSESDEGEGDPAPHPACSKPPRAPPRGRPTAAAVPGRRRVLGDDADTAKRRKKKKNGLEERGELGCIPTPQLGKRPLDAQHMAHANGEAPSAACKAAKQAAAARQPCPAQPSRQALRGNHHGSCAVATPDQAGKADEARGAAGEDAQAGERARRERKRAKKLRQKQQRAAGAVSEEAAALERARKARKKQRLKLARQQRRDAAGEAGTLRVSRTGAHLSGKNWACY